MPVCYPERLDSGALLAYRVNFTCIRFLLGARNRDRSAHVGQGTRHRIHTPNPRRKQSGRYGICATPTLGMTRTATALPPPANRHLALGPPCVAVGISASHRPL